jgi:hypothetical protein
VLTRLRAAASDLRARPTVNDRIAYLALTPGDARDYRGKRTTAYQLSALPLLDLRSPRLASATR